MTELSEPTTTRPQGPQPAPAGPRWVAPLGAVASGFTALCCIGVSAAVSLSTAVGATFLTRDSTLRPLLAVTLAVTVAGSALTYWRRRRPVSLAVSAVAAIWVYSFVYLVGGGRGGHGSPMADHMADHMATSHSAAFSGGRLVAVWLGLAVLVGSQLWDLVDIGRMRPVDPGACATTAHPMTLPSRSPTGSVSGFRISAADRNGPG